MDLKDLTDAQIEQVESLFDENGEEIPEAQQYVRCECCQIKYPADDDYWYFKDGKLIQPCIECVRIQSEKKHEKELMSAAKGIITQTSKAKDALTRLKQGELIEVSEAEHLKDAVVNEFGGISAFAAMMRNLYFDPKPNTNRVRLLELYVKLVLKVDESAHGKGKAHEGVSEDDIRAILERLMPTESNATSGG